MWLLPHRMPSQAGCALQWQGLGIRGLQGWGEVRAAQCHPVPDIANSSQPRGPPQGTTAEPLSQAGGAPGKMCLRKCKNTRQAEEEGTKRSKKQQREYQGQRKRGSSMAGVSCSPQRTYTRAEYLQPVEDMGHSKGKVQEGRSRVKHLHPDHHIPLPSPPHAPQPLIAALEAMSVTCGNKAGRKSSWNKVELGKGGQEVFSLCFNVYLFGSQSLNQ